MLLAWLLGTAWQLTQPHLWSALAYGQLLVFAVLCTVLLRLLCPGLQGWQSAVKRVALLGLVGALAFATVGWRALVFSSDTLAVEWEGEDLWVTGVIANMPQIHLDGVRFQFEIDHAVQSRTGQTVQIPADIQLAWYTLGWDGERKTLPPLQAGERWTFPVRLKRPHGLVNPGGFDAELWFWEQGIRATGHVRDGARDPVPLRLQATWQYPIEQLRQGLRSRILLAEPDPRWAGLIAGLLIGDQAAIDHTDWDVFRITGIAHLMSISGLHITLWAWVARWLVWQLWRYSDMVGGSWCLRYPAPHAALWGGVLFAASYAVFSGWGVPAQRTVAMLTLAGMLRLHALRWPLRTQWLMAAVLVVLIDPWALMQAGFWLSFVAVGVLFLSTPAANLPQSLQLVREQLRISICLAPLSVILFQQVSLVGVLVNLLAIPWVTLVVTPLAFAGSLWAPLWQLCSLSLQAMCAILEPLSQLSWAVWHVAAPPVWVGAVGVTGGALLAWCHAWKQRLLAMCMLLPCFWWPVSRPAPGHLELVAADIGQGNAVLVRTATHSLLFDTGPRFGSESDAGQRVLLPLLQHLNEHLDILVLSHQDSDHTGGALSVHRLQPQAEVFTSMAPGHWMAGQMALRRCEAGQHWQWDGVAFDMLHPLAEDYQKMLSPNARSCVLRISALGQVVLLTADIEALQESALVQRRGRALQADVLLVPHHGSKTSSTESFLEVVHPRWALFQMGYRNRYGHPAPQVMQRYVQRGIGVRLSPQCGAMTWRSQEPDVMHCEREQNHRYWQ